MIVLGLVWGMGIWLNFGGGEQFFLPIYLGIAACEGSLGLAVLVCLVRSHGRDKFILINTLGC
jgi:NADH:ubiquinone oxidoreductase subunit K